MKIHNQIKAVSNQPQEGVRPPAFLSTHSSREEAPPVTAFTADSKSERHTFRRERIKIYIINKYFMYARGSIRDYTPPQ